MTDAARHPFPVIEFRQYDWMPGFAAYVANDGGAPDDPAFCVLNLGSLLSGVAAGDMSREQLVEEVAHCMFHEILHVVEHWAGVEFSDDRVESLIAKYTKWVTSAPDDVKAADDKYVCVSKECVDAGAEVVAAAKRHMLAVRRLGEHSGYNKMTFFEAPIGGMPNDELGMEAVARWRELNDAGKALSEAVSAFEKAPS